MTYKDYAAEVMGMMDATLDSDVSPVVLSLIVEVIAYIVKNCILNKKKANGPNFIDRWKLSALVNRLGKVKMVDRETRDRVYDALLKKGSMITQHEIEDLLANAGSH